MSIVTQAFIVERYGLRLSTEKLAEALDMAKQTIANQVAKGTFPVKTYVDSGRRWADYRDVAEYIDQCRRDAA